MTTQPTNAKTGKAYTGGNTTILLQNDYTDQVWATYRQWQNLGYQVQKGQKGERITKMVKIICKKEHKQKLVPRYYTVFNRIRLDGSRNSRRLYSLIIATT